MRSSTRASGPAHERSHGCPFQSHEAKAQCDQFVQLLATLPIDVEPRPFADLLLTALQVARLHALSAYDAAYPDLALRLELPLATLDTRLIAAAQAAGVTLFAPSPGQPCSGGPAGPQGRALGGTPSERQGARVRQSAVPHSVLPTDRRWRRRRSSRRMPEPATLRLAASALERPARRAGQMQ